MRLYLDTEWADVAASQLVSLALVDSTAKHRFYAEIDPLPPRPTTFVRDVIYPRLERGTRAMAPPALTASLRRFLVALPEPRLVLADHPTDFTLLRFALLGFGTSLPGVIPDWKPIHVTQGDVLMQLELYFDRHAGAHAARHHAGVDAEALRWAFESVLEGAVG